MTLRLSSHMRRALLRERDGRLPLLEAALRAENLRERKGAEKTKMALIARGILEPKPYACCELTETGKLKVADLRVQKVRAADRERRTARSGLLRPAIKWKKAGAMKSTALKPIKMEPSL